MSEERIYSDDSPAVQAHLEILQGIIQRMASNSASCKSWCITLVAGVLVLVADKGVPKYALIAIIPTFLFLVLDTYYLALEEQFRGSYNEFIGKLHEGKIVVNDVYSVAPRGSLARTFFQALGSFSIWPFYLTLGLMIGLSMFIVIPGQQGSCY